MMRSVIALTVLTATMGSAAAHATECEFETNRIDKFTKQRQVATKWRRLKAKIDGNFDEELGRIDELAVQGRVEGTQEYLVFRIKTASVSRFFVPNPQELRRATSVKPGSPLKITLADDTSVVLLAEDFAYADVDVKVDDGVTLTDSVTESLFLLDADTITALAAQASTHMQLQGLETNFDIKIQKKSVRQVQKAVACIQ
jgi:hypothetical protein